MNDAFASGHIIDAIIALMLLEAVLLGLVHNRTGRGIPLGGALSFLASGAALMLALRAALTGANWQHISAFMLIGLVAHLVDLWTRWK